MAHQQLAAVALQFAKTRDCFSPIHPRVAVGNSKELATLRVAL
jgi:hypothetical protein